METIEEYIQRHRKDEEKREDFVVYLYELMDKYGFKKNSDLYARANISKQVFSQIISQKVNPSLNTCFRLVFAMRLSNHECKYLFKKAGYTLASSSLHSLIIRYCIDNKIYDLYQVNEYLVQYGYETI